MYRIIALCALLFSLLVVSASVAGEPPADSAAVRVLGVRGAINPVTASFLKRNLADAARRGDRLVLMEMDTPGGLDTAMREIVKDILASPVPVAVHVAPSGARAASAGAVICLAADICAMAPGTNIGAAHPVSLGEKQDKVMEEKVVNDAEAYAEGLANRRGRNAAVARRMVRESLSLSAERARDEKVIDLVVADRAGLLKQLDGWKVSRGEGSAQLRLAGAVVREEGMTARERILDVIGNPNVAYVLLMLGFLGIFFELSNPGVILPGVIGGISLILAFFALQTLPVNYAGLGLVVLGLLLMIAEAFTPSAGAAALGGAVAFVLGATILIDTEAPGFGVPWTSIVAIVAASLAFSLLVLRLLWRARQRPVKTGERGMLGERGTVLEWSGGRGRVLAAGERWHAVGDVPLEPGQRVRVVAIDGLVLRVVAES